MNTYLSVTTNPVEQQDLAANGCGISSNFVGKNVTKWSVENNIIQTKIRKLYRDNRRFSIKSENREEKEESEPSSDKRIRLHTDDEISESFSDVSALLYISKGENKNYNCKFYRNKQLITCSTLSHWWLTNDKFKYNDIASEKLIEEYQDLQSVSVIIKESYNNRCPSEGIYFNAAEFQDAIYHVATTLTKGKEKRYLMSSYRHAMGLCIQKNEYNNIIIYYYDPNDTLRHKKIIAKTENVLKTLRYHDFWNFLDILTYFDIHDKIGCLTSLDMKDLQKDCKVVCMTRPSAKLTYQLCMYGHYGHSVASFNFDKDKQKQFLSGKSRKNISALYVACYYEHKESVNALLKTISAIDLPSEEKKELLAGKTADGTPALYIACKMGYHEIVNIFIKTVFAIDCLSSDEKKELLAGKTADGTPALYIACSLEYHEIVNIFIKTVFAIDCLSSDEKKELLAGKTADGTPALYIACRLGYHKIVKTFIQMVFAIDCLSSDEKKELLAGKKADGTPALHVACYVGHYETVKAFIKTVSITNCLSSDEKKELLAGKTTDGTPALYIDLISL